VPPDDRLGLDDRQRLPPVFPDPRKEDPEKSVRLAKAWFLGSPLPDGKLVAKGQVFKRQVVLRTEGRVQGAEWGEKHVGEPIADLALTATHAMRTRSVEGTSSPSEVRTPLRYWPALLGTCQETGGAQGQPSSRATFPPPLDFRIAARRPIRFNNQVRVQHGSDRARSSLRTVAERGPRTRSETPARRRRNRDTNGRKPKWST
jgi:hypothetical protein